MSVLGDERVQCGSLAAMGDAGNTARRPVATLHFRRARRGCSVRMGCSAHPPAFLRPCPPTPPSPSPRTACWSRVLLDFWAGPWRRRSHAAGHEVLRGARAAPVAASAGERWVGYGDIGPATRWDEALAGVDVVVHLAGLAHLPDAMAAAAADTFARVNAEGTGAARLGRGGRGRAPLRAGELGAGARRGKPEPAHNGGRRAGARKRPMRAPSSTRSGA